VIKQLRTRTDTDLCCSSGQCAAALPEIFDQDDADGRVILLVERPSAELTAAVLEAVDCCPGGAITAEENDA
jgi:ferredoxin